MRYKYGKIYNYTKNIQHTTIQYSENGHSVSVSILSTNTNAQYTNTQYAKSVKRITFESMNSDAQNRRILFLSTEY